MIFPEEYPSKSEFDMIVLLIGVPATADWEDTARTAVRKELKATPLQKRFTPPREGFFNIASG